MKLLTAHRARLLRAAVGFALVPPTEPELRLLHRWLDCWRGVGDAVTMAEPRRLPILINEVTAAL